MSEAEEVVELEKDPSAITVDKSDLLSALGLDKPAEEPTEPDTEEEKEEKTEDPAPEPEVEPKKDEPSNNEETNDDDEIDIDDLVNGSDTDTSEEESTEEEVDTSKMEEKDAEAFKNMRVQIKELKEQLKGGVTDEERKELETLREKVYSTDLSASPEFQRKYINPMQSKVQQIRDMGKEFGLTEDVVQKAANLGFRDRKTLLMEEVPDIQAELSIMYGELDALNKARTSALGDAKSSLSSLQESATQERNTAFEETLAALKEAKMIPLLESKSKKWNDAVTARIDTAKDLMANSDPKVVADMALKAAMAEEYQALVLRLQAQLKEATGKSGAVKKATPKIGGRRAGTPTGSKDDIRKAIADGKMSVADALV